MDFIVPSIYILRKLNELSGDVFTDIVSNRADELIVGQFKNIRNKNKLPTNHDIEKAVLKSSFKAATYYVNQIAKVSEEHDQFKFLIASHRKALDKIRKNINKAYNKIEKNELQHNIESSSDNIENLVLHQRESAEGEKLEFSNFFFKLILEEEKESYKPVITFIQRISSELTGTSNFLNYKDLISIFFIEEIKTNDRLAKVIHSNFLVELSLDFKDFQKELISFSKSNADILSVSKETNINVKKILDIVEKTALIVPSYKDFYVQAIKSTLLETNTALETPNIFIAREKELNQIHRIFDKVIKHNSAQIVIVKGDYGTGKTTLFRKIFIDIISSSDNSVIGLHTKFIKENSDSGYLGFIELLESLIRTESDLIPEELFNFMYHSAPAWLEMLYSKPDLVQELDSNREDFSSDNLKIQYLRLLKKLIGNRTFVIIVEDLHFIDESSMKLLTYIVDKLQGSKILFLCSQRPILRRVDGLTEKEILSFNEDVLSILKNGNISSLIVLKEGINALDFANAKYINHNFNIEILNLLEKKSGNQPLFIDQVFQLWENNAVIFLDDCGVWQMIEEAKITLPETVRLVLKNRIELLTKESIEIEKILNNASVAGEEFCAQSILDAVDSSLDENIFFNEYIEKILVTKYNLLQYSNESDTDSRLDYYFFIHKFIQEYLYSNLGNRQRKMLHERIGNHLEGFYSEKPAYAGVLANHFFSALNHLKSLKYAKVAVEYEYSKYSWIEGLKWCERSLTILKNTTEHSEYEFFFLTKAGIISLNLGEMKDAYVYLTKVIQTENKYFKLEETLPLYSILAEVCDEMGDFRKGLEIVEQGEKAFNECSTSNLTDLHSLEIIKLLLQIRCNDYQGVEQKFASLHEQMLLLDKSQIVSRNLARLNNVLGIYYDILENYNNAAIYYDKAYEFAEEAKDRQTSLTIISNRASAYLNLGNIQESHKLIESALEKSKEVNDKGNEAYALQIKATILMKEGKYMEAIPHLNISINLMKETSSLYLFAYNMAIKAKCLFETNQMEEAKQFIKLAIDQKNEDEWLNDYIDDVNKLINGNV